MLDCTIANACTCTWARGWTRDMVRAMTGWGRVITSSSPKISTKSKTPINPHPYPLGSHKRHIVEQRHGMLGGFGCSIGYSSRDLATSTVVDVAGVGVQMTMLDGTDPVLEKGF